MGFEPTTSRYQYNKFSASPENTQSYVFKLTTCIILHIWLYIYFHSSWMLCLFDGNLRDHASHMLCIWNDIFNSIHIYIYIYIYIDIACLFTCMDLARAIDNRCPWPPQSTSYRKLNASHTFSWLDLRHETSYKIYVYEMDFSVSSINLMISMRSSFIYENHHTSI